MKTNSLTGMISRLTGEPVQNTETPATGVARDNTEQVRGSVPPPATTGRPPDKWVINDKGQQVPVWLDENDVKPWWQSKIFITQALSLAFTVAALFGDFDVSPETQQLIIGMALTVASGGSVLTTLFRFFASDKKLVK